MGAQTIGADAGEGHLCFETFTTCPKHRDHTKYGQEGRMDPVPPIRARRQQRQGESLA